MTFLAKLKPKWRVFEEWCQVEEANEPQIKLDLQPYRVKHLLTAEHEAVDAEYVKAVRDNALSSNDHLFVSIDRSGAPKFYLKIDLSDDDRLKTLSPQTKSHIRRLLLRKCEGVELSAALIRDLDVGIEVGPIKLEGCRVGVMLIRDGARADIELQNCWIGILDLADEAVARLSITGGSIRAIYSHPPHRGNPFVGSVTISDVDLPTTSKSLLLKVPQTYSNLRSHLEELKNVPAANLMRAKELATEPITIGD